MGPSGPEGHVFRVWAPERKRMLLHLVHPEERTIEMEADGTGGFILAVPGTGAGTRYFYRPDDEGDFPDPASHFQPEGVHGPSEIVDHSAHVWHHTGWRGIPLREMAIYELHVGAFTPEGTFAAAIPRLEELTSLGVTAVEVMPVAQFPGSRNWGYDGVCPYAVQNSYGGPDGFKEFVDACHGLGIAVILDVVYNHLGPEGNHLARFGPYFTGDYRTPWGSAVNLDGAWSDGVREYFADNMLHWFERYRVDALRVDAIHFVFDRGAVPFWHFAREKVRRLEGELGRPLLLIAENDTNSPRVTQGPESGGLGFDAQWLDDFHHALYVLVDPEGRVHYEDFGSLAQLAKAYTDGFVHSGEFVRFRKRKHGASSAGVPGDRFVVFNQNHDQVGNRVRAERLPLLTDFPRLKLAAAALLLSPYVPLLFMGEEYGEEAPFHFFASYEDAELVRIVRENRKREFAAFRWGGGEPADPFSEETFRASILRWESRREGRHRVLLEWHRTLLSLRRGHPALRNLDKSGVSARVLGDQGVQLWRRSADGREELACVFNFSGTDLSCELAEDPAPESGGPGKWVPLLNSLDARWAEDGDPGKESADSARIEGPSVTLGPWGAAAWERISG